MKKKYVIGIDARTFFYSNSISRGIGNYTLNHLAEIIKLQPEWDFILYYEYEENSNALNILLENSNVSKKRFVDYKKGEIGLLHIPDPMNTSLGFDSPFRLIPNVPLTVLFHDLIPLYFYYDQWEKTNKNLYDFRLEQIEKLNCHILTNSNFTKEDLIFNTNIPPDRITPIWAGLNRIDSTKKDDNISFGFIKKKFGLTKPYFLFVGALDDHKNFEATLKAFVGFNKKNSSQLVVVGKKDGKTKIWEDIVIKKKIKDVVFTGYVSRDELEILYCNAVSLLFMSKYEGFGFPVLEAMANGCPVITSNLTSLSEVAGDAALLVNHENLIEIVEQMQTLYDKHELRNNLIKAGYERAKLFTWERSAKKTINVWCNLIGIERKFSEDFNEENILKYTDSPIKNDTNKIKVLWQSPIFDVSGYADEARNFVLGLDELGVNIKIISKDWNNIKAKLPEEDLNKLIKLSKNYFINLKNPKIQVVHSFPDKFEINRRAFYNVGRTMFETDRIPVRWVSKCNQMDEIWVPSDFNLNSFALSGVAPEKLFKIPEAIDTKLFDIKIPKLKEISSIKGFKFLSVFDWNLRKGWDVLIKAFSEEFRNDKNVKLILKVWSSYGLSLEEIQKELKHYFTKNKISEGVFSRIIFYPKNLPNTALPKLYKSVDAFVLPTRGEGWGRPLMEAMTMQVPTIATKCSGQLEFMNDDNSHLIECEYVDIPEKAFDEVPDFRGHKWAEPSVEHLKSIMRDVYENYDIALAKAKIGRQFILDNFSREKIANLIYNKLSAIYDRAGKNNSGKNGITVFASNLTYSQFDRTKNKVVVNWEGSFDGKSSLSIVNINIASELEKYGININKFSEEVLSGSVDKNLVYISHTWPPKLIPPKNGHWIIIQPWEFGSIPKEWLKVFNEIADAVWVPSKYVKNIYVESGVNKNKIAVIPNGFDPEKFNNAHATFKLKTKKKNKFLFVGGTIYRKGIDLILKAYTDQFTRDDDVVLIIKDIGSNSFYSGQNYSEELKKLIKNNSLPEIEYIDRFLSGEELKALYQTADVLVYPYRGEGFGLPILEAMACGTPVIVPDAGAATDFCNSENSFLLKAEKTFYKEMKVGNLETVSYPWLYEVSVDDLKSIMKYIIQNPLQVEIKGRKAYKDVHTNFTWEKAALKAAESLNLLINQPINRFINQSAFLFYLEKSFTSIEENEQQEAIKFLNSAILLLENKKYNETVNVELDELYVIYGNLNLAINNLENAKRSFETALNHNPTSSQACVGLGEVFYNSEMYEEAKTMYEWAVVNNVQNKTAINGLAKVNKKLGYPEKHNTVVEEQKLIENQQTSVVK